MEKMTEKQIALVNGIVAGKNPAQAVRDAGYSDKTQFHVISTPAIMDAIRERTGQMLQQLAPRAVMVAAELMESDTATDKIRLDASRLVLDRAGYIAPKAPEAQQIGEKALHEMTRQELAERAARLQKEISDRAAPVIDAAISDTGHPEMDG